LKKCGSRNAGDYLRAYKSEMKNRHIILEKSIMMCSCFYMQILEVFTMKKLKMTSGVMLTFEEGCNKYLEYCRQRNLREGTIRHYKQSYGIISP